MKANKAVTFKRKLVYAAVASCFSVLPAYGNPIGATVVNGGVSFATQNNTLNITNTPNAIINWQQFNIQVGQTTRFIQQSAQSAVLNRVVGQDPSQILGSLLSNGRVFLINPNGIVFGADAIVDVAGLVASTLRLSDGDFLAGRMNFTDGVGAGSIVNQGNISTPTGGNIYLIAPDIQNSGVITSPQGEILLAAGHTVNLMDVGNPNVQVSVSAPATQAINLGTLMAQSGKIGLYASLIDQSGVINADTAVQGENGVIRLQASQDITLQPGSVTTASGMAGGVRDGGEIRIIADGTLNMRQSSEVHVDGGVDGGNGGFLELSGKERIALNGIFTGRARAEGYRNGSLLLDPTDILICNSFAACGGNSPVSLSTVGGGDGSVLSSDTPAGTLYLDPDMDGAWSNVSLAASSNITIASLITDGDIPVGGSLTLIAGINIDINADIGTSITRFNHDLTLDAGNDININASIYMGTNTLTLTAVNDVLIQAGSNTDAIVDTLGNISVTAAGLAVLGGTASESSFPGNVTRTADATLSAGGNMTLTLGTGGLTVQGGTATLDFCGDCDSGGISGTVTANATVHAGGDASITISGDGVLIQGGSDVSARGASMTGTTTLEARADATLSVDGNLNLTLSSGDVTVRGGSFASSGSSSLSFAPVQAHYGYPGTTNHVTASANALFSIGGNADITISSAGSVFVYGGTNAFASASSMKGITEVTASANAALSAGGNLNLDLNGGEVSVSAGIPAFAIGSGSSALATTTITASANALLAAGSLLTITGATGGLTIQGGGANAAASHEHIVTVTASADATVSAGTLTLTNGDLLVAGGGATASAACGSSPACLSAVDNATASANANLQANTINILAGSLTIQGGGAGASVSSAAISTINATANANATVLYSSLNVSGPLSIVPGTATPSGIGAFAFANAGVQLIPIPPVIPPVSSLPDPVITTINFTIGEINRSAPPRVLTEGIRYGDEGEEDYGKPECS